MRRVYGRADINWLTRTSDMFTPSMRVTLMLLALVLGGYLLAIGSLAAWLFFSLAIMLLWNYFRQNAVWSAFRAFQARDFARVKSLLQYVRWPNLLDKPSKAYYHWLQGVVAAADGRLGAAQVHLLVATTGALRSTNDRCLVQCLLAEVALQLGDRSGAREHLRLARALEHHADVGSLLRSLDSRVNG